MTSFDPGDPIDDLIRAFLAATAKDTGRMRDAAAMTAAIGAQVERRLDRRPLARTALLLAVIGSLIVAMIALAISGGSKRPIANVDAVRTPSPSTMTSPTVSADPDRFTTHTSMGDIQWTRVALEHGIWVQGLVDGSFIGDTDDGAWYASRDGVRWETMSPPPWQPRLMFGADEDQLGIDSPDGGGTMMGPVSHRQVFHKEWTDGGDPAIRRLDGEEWAAIEVPVVAPVPPKGTTLRGTAYETATTLDATHWLVPTVSFIEIPWDKVLGGGVGQPTPRAGGAEQGLWPIWTEEDERLRLGQPYANGRVTMTVELVDGDPPRIEFRDDTTGDLVHSVPAVLPGWTPEALLRGFRYWGIEDRGFLVGHDGEVSLVRPPFEMGEEFVGITTAFHRYYMTSLVPGPDFTVRAVHVWESTDGMTWRPVALPDLPTDRLKGAMLNGRPDSLLLGIEADDGTEWTWSSSDGAGWTPADRPAAGLHEVVATESVWISNDAFGESAISADGVHWEVMSRPPLSEPGFALVRDRLFLRSGDDMWVAQIDLDG